MFKFSEKEALEKIDISVVIKQEGLWSGGRLSNTGLFWGTAIYYLMIFSTVALPYALVKIAQTHTSNNPLYPFNDYWLTLTEWFFPVAAVICGLLIVHQWLTGLLYRKCNHVKYSYHHGLAQFISIVPVISGFHLAAMLFLPEVFQGFRLFATPLLSFALIYKLYSEVKSTARQLERDELSEHQKHFNKIYKKLLRISFLILPIGILFRFGSGAELKDFAMSFITPMFFVIAYFLSGILLDIALNQFLRAFYVLKYPEGFRLKAAKNPFDWYGYRCMKSNWVQERLAPKDKHTYKLGQAYEEKSLADNVIVQNPSIHSKNTILPKKLSIRWVAFIPAMLLSVIIAAFLFATVSVVIIDISTQSKDYFNSKDALLLIFLLILILSLKLPIYLWQKNQFGLSFVSGRINPKLLHKIKNEEEFVSYIEAPELGISEKYLLAQSSPRNGHVYPLSDIAAFEIEETSDDSAYLYIYTKKGKRESLLFLSPAFCVEIAKLLQNRSGAKWISHLSELQFLDWQKDYQKSLYFSKK